MQPWPSSARFRRPSRTSSPRSRTRSHVPNGALRPILPQRPTSATAAPRQERWCEDVGSHRSRAARVWIQERRTCPGVMAVGVLRARRYSGSYPERSVGEASPIRSIRPSIGLHPVGCAQPKDRPSQRHNSSIVTPSRQLCDTAMSNQTPQWWTSVRCCEAVRIAHLPNRAVVRCSHGSFPSQNGLRCACRPHGYRSDHRTRAGPAISGRGAQRGVNR
jgi:hypothetical protein